MLKCRILKVPTQRQIQMQSTNSYIDARKTVAAWRVEDNIYFNENPKIIR